MILKLIPQSFFIATLYSLSTTSLVSAESLGSSKGPSLSASQKSINPAYFDSYLVSRANHIAEEYQKAASLFRQGEYASSVSHFSRIIVSPKSSAKYKNRSLVGRAQAYLIIGQPRLALQDLLKTEYKENQIDQKITKMNLLGTTYIQLQSYAEAIRWITEAIKLSPSDASLYSNRSVAYKALNLLDQATNDLNLSLKLNPTPSSVYNLAILEKEKGNFSRCYFLLSNIMDPDSAYTDIFIQRGLCAMKINRKDEALKDFLRSVSIDSQNPVPIENIGSIMLEQGDKKNGMKYLELAAQVYLQIGDVEAYSRISKIVSGIR